MICQLLKLLTTHTDKLCSINIIYMSACDDLWCKWRWRLTLLSSLDMCSIENYSNTNILQQTIKYFFHLAAFFWILLFTIQILVISHIPIHNPSKPYLLALPPSKKVFGDQTTHPFTPPHPDILRYWVSTCGRMKDFYTHCCPTSPSQLHMQLDLWGFSMCTFWMMV